MTEETPRRPYFYFQGAPFPENAQIRFLTAGETSLRVRPTEEGLERLRALARENPMPVVRPVERASRYPSPARATIIHDSVYHELPSSDLLSDEEIQREAARIFAMDFARIEERVVSMLGQRGDRVSTVIDDMNWYPHRDPNRNDYKPRPAPKLREDHPPIPLHDHLPEGVILAGHVLENGLVYIDGTIDTQRHPKKVTKNTVALPAAKQRPKVKRPGVLEHGIPNGKDRNYVPCKIARIPYTVKERGRATVLHEAWSEKTMLMALFVDGKTADKVLGFQRISA